MCLACNAHGAVPAFGTAASGWPDESWVIPGCTADSVRHALTSRSTHPLEGIWRDPASGTEVAVMKAPGVSGMNPLFLMVILKPAVIGLRCGTVVGRINPSARDNYYEARLFSKYSPGRLYHPANYFLHSSGSHMSVTKKRKGLRLSLRRILPFLGFSLRETDNTPTELEGFLRIFPVNPDRPEAPVLL